MRGSPSPMRGALLGLLRERPGYAYELSRRMETRLGPAWNLRGPGLYPMLDALLSDGLISKAERETTLRQGQRVDYHITDKGMLVLADWMARDPEPEELRSGLIARIAVASPQDVPTLLAHLDEAERACLAQAAAAADRTPPRTWDDLCLDLISEKAEVRLEGDVAWIEYARDRLRQFVARTAG